MTHNEKQNPLLYLFITCISTRSATQILSLKDECKFRFSNFLVIGLYYSSDNYWFGIVSLSTPLPEDVLSKKL